MSLFKNIVFKKYLTAIDIQIDRMVYGLYGLTEEEIAIIEKISSNRRVSIWLN